MKFRFITAIWGEWHRTAMLTANLPSLLAPGNLPLASGHQISFEIYTSRSDAPIIAKSESYRQVAALVPSKIVELSEETLRQGDVANQPIWKMAMDEGELVPVGLMAPDMVWADGAIERLIGCFEAGKRAVYMTVLRVIDETFMADVLANKEICRADGAMVITPRHLVQLTIEHFHPLHITSIADCPYHIRHFEHFFHPVSRNALLARTLAAHCLAIDPGFYEVNEFFSPAKLKEPEQIEFAAGVEGVFGVSLTPLTKGIDWYEDRIVDYDTNTRGKWSYMFYNPVHERLQQVKFKFYAEDTPPSAWSAGVASTDEIIRGGQVGLGLIWLWHSLREDPDCKEAAKILAEAAIIGNLADHWTHDGPVTVFVPRTEASTKLPAWYCEALLSRNSEVQLLDLVKRHTVPVALDLVTPPQAPSAGKPNGDATRFTVWNMAGDEIAVERNSQGASVNGFKVVGSKVLPNGSRVYIVDGLLEATLT